MERHGQQVASRSITLRHGHVFTPPSRAYLAWQAGEIDEGALNQRESGKFFPHSAGGQPDPFAKDDVVNALPPPDGKIASANQATGALLDQPVTIGPNTKFVVASAWTYPGIFPRTT